MVLKQNNGITAVRGYFCVINIELFPAAPVGELSDLPVVFYVPQNDFSVICGKEKGFSVCCEIGPENGFIPHPAHPAVGDVIDIASVIVSDDQVFSVRACGVCGNHSV